MQGRKPQRTPQQPVARDPGTENQTIHPNREHPRVKSLKVEKRDPARTEPKARAPAPRALLSKNLRVVTKTLKRTSAYVKPRAMENPPPLKSTKGAKQEPPPRQPDVGRDPLAAKRRKPSQKNVLHSSAPRVKELPKSVVKRVRYDVKRGR